MGKEEELSPYGQIRRRVVKAGLLALGDLVFMSSLSCVSPRPKILEPILELKSFEPQRRQDVIEVVNALMSNKFKIKRVDKISEPRGGLWPDHHARVLLEDPSQSQEPDEKKLQSVGVTNEYFESTYKDLKKTRLQIQGPPGADLGNIISDLFNFPPDTIMLIEKEKYGDSEIPVVHFKGMTQDGRLFIGQYNSLGFGDVHALAPDFPTLPNVSVEQINKDTIDSAKLFLSEKHLSQKTIACADSLGYDKYAICLPYNVFPQLVMTRLSSKGREGKNMAWRSFIIDNDYGFNTSEIRKSEFHSDIFFLEDIETLFAPNSSSLKLEVSYSQFYDHLRTSLANNFNLPKNIVWQEGEEEFSPGKKQPVLKAEGFDRRGKFELTVSPNGISMMINTAKRDVTSFFNI